SPIRLIGCRSDLRTHSSLIRTRTREVIHSTLWIGLARKMIPTHKPKSKDQDQGVVRQEEAAKEGRVEKVVRVLRRRVRRRQPTTVTQFRLNRSPRRDRQQFMTRWLAASQLVAQAVVQEQELHPRVEKLSPMKLLSPGQPSAMQSPVA